MMTMKQILKSTPISRRRKAESVKLVDLKIRKNPDNYPMILAKTKSLENHKGEPKKMVSIQKYISSIEILPKGYVILSCSCDDFMYTWEVALKKQGAARIEYSNGKMPGDKNPALVPGCCGHLVALGNYLIDKGKL